MTALETEARYSPPAAYPLGTFMMFFAEKLSPCWKGRTVMHHGTGRPQTVLPSLSAIT